MIWLRIIRWGLALVWLISVGTTARAGEVLSSDELPPISDGQSWQLVWNDEFDGGQLDQTKWEILGDWKRRDGFWIKEDSYVDGKGNLVLRTKKDGERYTSGAIRTKGKFERAYGYWVVRCQLPEQPGHWPAFWLMCDGVTKVGNEGRDGTEIDIVEIPWRDGQITMNLHWDGYGKAHKSAGSKVTIPKLTGGFHTFALWWQTNEYVFYTDGQETWRTAAGGVSQVPEFVKLTEEIGKWGGEIQKAELPDYFLVDYVRVYAVKESPAPRAMRAVKDAVTGQIDVLDSGKPVLRYNYETVAPGDRLGQVQPANLKYARPRSDYIHPLYGLSGEELTRDWPVDHPHHRGIYWAWPEVQFGAEVGDLHALQRVFSRPTGRCGLQSGPEFAQIDAENIWLWEDQEPIVRERTIIRAHRASEQGRRIDLKFEFTALKDGVTLARRGTDKYGGLNIRLASVADQEIVFRTDPVESQHRMAWAELAGRWPGGQPSALVIFQKQSNPGYPGDWVKFPEINWIQPTFPTSGTRFPLKQTSPLTLEFRIWIRPGGQLSEQRYMEQWMDFSAEANADSQ